VAIASDEHNQRTHGPVHDGNTDALFIHHRVSMRQGIADAESEVERSVVGEAAPKARGVAGQNIGQRNAVQVFEHEDHGVAVEEYLMGSNDARMCQLGACRHFANELARVVCFTVRSNRHDLRTTLCENPSGPSSQARLI
jgi:hypothetical protein